MIHYKPVFTTLDAEQLAEILIEAIFKYHGFLNSIFSDRQLLFTSKFWSSFYYYLNIKRRLSIIFYPQIDGQTKRQNSIIKAYLQAYSRFE